MQRLRSKILLILSFSPLVLPSPPASGKEIAGPQVAIESAGKTNNTQRRRYEASLLAPIPARFMGGVLVAKADFFKEDRSDSLSRERFSSKDPGGSDPDVAALGAVYLPHAAEGAPRFFLLAARYDQLSFNSSVRPMGEYIIGADLDDDDTPFELRFDPSDESESRVLVRYRQFPGHHRWLLVVGHKIHRRSGLCLELTLPTDAVIGWETPDYTWKFYAAGRINGREYPMTFTDSPTGETGEEESRGWIEGHQMVGLLGVRRKLTEPLYLAFEAGAQRETLAFYSENGETLSHYQSRVAPWARLALETYWR